MTATRHQRRLLGPAVFGALLLFAAVLAAIAAQQGGSPQSAQTYPTYDVHSSGPQGTRALSLWLARLGYRPRTLEYQPFRLSDSDTLLLMLFPSLDPTSQQVNAILNWVEQGGTLVVASGEQDSLLTQLGVTVSPSDAQSVDAHAAQATLLNPPISPVTVDTYAELSFRDAAWIPLLDGPNTGDVLAASLTRGKGAVVVLSTGDPFTNSGLTQPGNGAFVLNLLASVPAGGGVVIDEYHHGFTEQGTFTRQLLVQPWGRAILFAVAVIFTFIVASGLRFGPAVRPHAHTLKRRRSEFAETLAAMLHQNGHREWLRDNYMEQLKRRLGARFRVRSNLPTSQFVEQLIQRDPSAAALGAPLEQLEAERAPDEGRLVALIRDTDLIAARLIEEPAARHTEKHARQAGLLERAVRETGI